MEWLENAWNEIVSFFTGIWEAIISFFTGIF